MGLHNLTVQLTINIMMFTIEPNTHPTEFLSTSSNEDVGEDTPWPDWAKILFGIIITVAIIVNIVGNTMTLIAFSRDSKLQTTQNMYIMNLAITDIAVAVNSMPFYALYTIRDFTWILGAAFCKAWLVLDYWVCAESSLTVILISYDRLLMVRDGLKYNQKQTTRRALVKILLTWCFSFFLYCPAILGYDHWRGHSEVDAGDCDTEFASVFWYTLFTATLEFLVPFTLLSVFSLMLYRNIHKRSRAIAKKSSDAAQWTSDKQEAQLRKDKKAARSLAILILTYAFCWTPYTICTVVYAFCEDCVNEDLYELFTWLLWLNSSCNPFLYAFTNVRFRAHYKKMLCPCAHLLSRNRVRPLSVENKEHTATTVS